MTQMTADTNMTWNGQQWLRWDGTQWLGASQPQPIAAGHYPGSDRNDQPVQMAVAWVLTILTVGYFLPWAVAATRGKSNSGAIGLVNLLLGWTLIGWVVALVMACGTHQRW
jgi:hypothetical protein